MSNRIEILYSKFLKSEGVSIDTRTIKKGNLFFGISGENSNGNEYALQALEKGASFAIIDDKKFAEDERIILVEDTLLSLQELAIFHREKFQGKVLAITGSNGKTTTKELVREVLSQKCVVHATEGNYNNHLGVPLTILQLTNQVEIAIIEMGANHLGEIARLCEIAKPNLGLITNIGQAHTEGFGGMDGVLRGKSELFDYLKRSNGIPFVNKQDNYLMHMTKRFDTAEVFPNIDVALIPNQEMVELLFRGKRIATRLTGDYNFLNMAAAISVGRYFDVEDKKIAQALESYTPENQRSQIIKRGSNTIILDAYNANPDSMRVALKNLANFEGRKVAILGQMNELAHSKEAHNQLGKEIARLQLDEVILVGEKMLPALEFLPMARHFKSTENLKDYLAEHSFQDSVVLLKASRSIGLEGVADSL
ncbi:MAG: UDP-N-acetylmuramoyl-tripeptide--D-alanyl-D-alanine ligase [Cytophagales bacterium]|nr:UDP-N-acetylmuramoyl-tripeptide--D-alanyl-D-alanine ligase [Cytophagales bacterium]